MHSTFSITFPVGEYNANHRVVSIALGSRRVARSRSVRFAACFRPVAARACA